MADVGRGAGWGPRVSQASLFLIAWGAVGLSARLVVPEGESLSLIWPAAGVAVLWFLVRGAGWRSPDVPLLAAVAFAVNYATGAAFDLSLLLAVANVVQTVVAVTMLRRWCPDLWGCGGERGFDSVRIVSRGLLAVAAGMAAGAVIGTVGLAALGQPVEALTAPLWFTRNLGGLLMVTPLGLLLWRQLASASPRPTVFDGSFGALEYVAACLFTLIVYAAGLGVGELPLTFLLPVATVWVGARFRPLATALHSSLVGVGTMAVTLAGWGQFAQVTDGRIEAALAQSYVVTVLFLGLVLSTRREENRVLGDGLREAGQHARFQANLLDAVITSMTDGVAVVDEQDRMLVRNPAADRLGFTDARSAGHGFEVFHTDGTPIPADQRPSQRALRGEVVEDEEVMLVPDGSGPVLSVTAVPLDDPDTDPDTDPDIGPGPGHATDPRALLIVRDETEAFTRRAELARFAGTVAHDLRNPLSAIEGWTEMIEDEISDGVLDPALAASFIQQVRLATGRMHLLIGDLLDHATSGNRRLDVEKVDLQEIVEAISQSRGVSDQVRCEALPWVTADRVLVSQVLDNLISNALKYVAPGVQPDVVVSGTTAGAGWARISVIDNGIGLPPGEQERIFQEFHRAHGSDYDGTGLGLAIVRRIVVRHGGTITARNRDDGGGSVFELTLPSYA